MATPFYVTTSIPYVNAAPHLGFALEFVQADTFARYHRLLGDDTRLLTGTDDNSLKNVLAAEREGVPVRELVDRNARVFEALAPALDLANDDFIRTSADARHLAGARRLWQVLDARGDIYKRHYQGLYCVGCEQFYAPDELAEGRCPEHGTLPETVREENYFFRLSRYQEALERLLDSGRLQIIPQTRRNEVRAFVARGLHDLSISRSRTRARGWGIEVPGDPEQVMYVWFDALANYITALGYGDGAEGAEAGALYQRYWIDNPSKVHVIGKDIIRFHAVYWPAMLLAAGEPLPDTIFVHGFLTIAGGRLSKSAGNVVDPLALAARYGADAVRYWLLREVPPTEDADYTDQKLERRYTADLANDLGNLLQRTVSMLHRYRQGRIPAPPVAGDRGEIPILAASVVARLHQSLGEGYDPQGALAGIWELVARANRYVEETAPWALARTERTEVEQTEAEQTEAERTAAAGRAGSGAAPPLRTGQQAVEQTGQPASERLDLTLYTLAETLRLIAEALRPFLPRTAAGMARQLGVTPEDTGPEDTGPEDTGPRVTWKEALQWGQLAPGTAVGTPEPLFPRLAGLEPAAVPEPVPEPGPVPRR